MNTCQIPAWRKATEYTIDHWSEIFTYEPGSGVLRWKPREENKSWTKRWGGKVAGSVHKRRGKVACVQVKVMGRVFKAHRIIWEMHYGDIPEGSAPDHIDVDGTNNRLQNLRMATDSQNKCNTPKYRNNTSGFKGVTRNKRDNKWRAQIKHLNKTLNLGSYDTIGMAALVRAKASIRYHGKFAHL